MAGLRDTDSKAEAEGVRRAREQIAAADLVLWLTAPDVADSPDIASSAPIWRLPTKADLAAVPPPNAISAQTGHGIAALLARIEAAAAAAAGRGEPALLSRERDRDALASALRYLGEAAARLAQPELAAEALRLASHALERLLGRIDAEAVLDRLFLSFCIGK
jgi:tRNA modification GTPase